MLTLISPNAVSLAAQICLTSLANMASGNHFSVCTVTDAAKVARVTIAPDTLARLRAIHCIDWDKISDGIRAWLASVFAGIIDAANAIAD